MCHYCIYFNSHPKQKHQLLLCLFHFLSVTMSWHLSPSSPGCCCMYVSMICPKTHWGGSQWVSSVYILEKDWLHTVTIWTHSAQEKPEWRLFLLTPVFSTFLWCDQTPYFTRVFFCHYTVLTLEAPLLQNTHFFPVACGNATDLKCACCTVLHNTLFCPCLIQPAAKVLVLLPACWEELLCFSGNRFEAWSVHTMAVWTVSASMFFQSQWRLGVPGVRRRKSPQ